MANKPYILAYVRATMNLRRTKRFKKIYQYYFKVARVILKVIKLPNIIL